MKKAMAARAAKASIEIIELRHRLVKNLTARASDRLVPLRRDPDLRDGDHQGRWASSIR